MADGHRPRPEARPCRPLVQDYVALAQRMPPDEIAQYLAATGLASFDPQEAAKTLLCIPGVVHCIANEEGRPIALGGYEPVRTGVWQCWMVSAAEDWPTYGRQLTRIVRRFQSWMLESPDCRRLQLYSLPERTQAHEWYLKGLGMTQEGRHRQYFADGSDALCFAIVKENCHVLRRTKH